MSFRWDKRCPDQLGQRVRDISIQEPQPRIIFLFYQLSGIVQGFDIVSRKVLHLDQTAGPSACPVGPVILGQSSHPISLPFCRVHSHIFLDGGLAKLLPDLKHPLHFLRIHFPVLKRFRHGGFLDIRKPFLSALLIQPGDQLGPAVGICKACNADRLICQLLGTDIVDIQGAFDQPCVHTDPVCIHDDVQPPLVLFCLRHGELVQAF